MLPSEIVNPCVIPFIYGGFVNPCVTPFIYSGFPAHFMWTTITFTEKLSANGHHKGHIVMSHKTTLQQQFAGK